MTGRPIIPNACALTLVLVSSLVFLWPGKAGAQSLTAVSPNVAPVYTSQRVRVTGSGTHWLTSAPAFALNGGGAPQAPPVSDAQVISDTVVWITVNTGFYATAGQSPFGFHETSAGLNSAFAVTGLPPATLTYTTVDALTFPGSVAAGGAGSTVTGGQDVSGGRWSITGGKLVGTKTSGNLTGNPWLLPGVGSSLNQEASAFFVGTDDTSGYVTSALRYQPDGSCLTATIDYGGSGGPTTLNLFVQKADGTFVYLGQPTSSPTNINTADTYRFDSFAEGRLPTRYYYRLTDVTTGAVILDTTGSPYLSSSNGSLSVLENAGRCGFTLRGGTTTLSQAQSSAAPFSVGLPAVTRTASGTSAVGLSAAPPPGAAGAVSYQWHRSLTPGFTPGVGTALAGATSATLTDAPPGNLLYYYKVVATDSAPAPDVVMSVDAPGSLWLSALSVGWIGDSIEQQVPTDSDGTAPFPAVVGQFLQQAAGLRSVTTVNQGVPGLSSSNWVVGGQFYPAAKAAFTAAGVTVVCVQLGANDASNGISAASYQANLAGFVNDLVASGIRVIIGYPAYRYAQLGPVSPMPGLLVGYQSAVDALVDNVHVFHGPTLTYGYFAEHPEEFGDGLHPNGKGVKSYARLWADAINRVLYPVSGGTKRKVQ